MQFKRNKCISIGFTFVSFLLIVIAVSSDSWVRKSVNHQDHQTVHERGLWQSCDPTCTSFEADHAINTCRTFGMIACLLILLAWALSIVAYVEYRVKAYMVSIISSMAAISMSITLIVYAVTNVYTSQDYSYSWSFMIGWVSIIVSLLSALWDLHENKIEDTGK